MKMYSLIIYCKRVKKWHYCGYLAHGIVCCFKQQYKDANVNLKLQRQREKIVIQFMEQEEMVANHQIIISNKTVTLELTENKTSLCCVSDRRELR